MLGQAPRAWAASRYSDVPPGSFGATAIADLTQRGIMHGVGGGMFMPDLPMTRAQMAALLARAEGWPLDGIGPAFTDVAPGDWFYTAVEAAAGQEAMRGVGGGRFDPNASETQAQAVVSAVRVLEMQHVAADVAPAAGVPALAAGAYTVGRGLGLLRGLGAPEAALTRAQAAVLVRALLAVTPAELRRQGDVVAAYVHVLPAGAGAADAVDAGARVRIRAYAHDRTGYIVPADFRWRASGGTITTGGLLTAGGAGEVRVTAHVPGGPSATLALQVKRPVALVFAPLSTVLSAGSTQSVTVEVVDGRGSRDPADGGRPIRLRAAGTMWSARDVRGRATFSIALPPGASTLTATAPGLTAAVRHVTATAATYAVVLSAPRAVLRAGQREPLAVTVVEGGGQALPGTFAVTLRATGGADVAGASATLAGPDAPAGVLRAPDPGTVTVTAAVAGGAVAGGSLTIHVEPAGRLAVSGPARLTAGSAATLTFRADVPDGTALAVALTDPDGNHPPGYRATFAAGAASVRFRQTIAGTWRLRGVAAGYLGTAAVRVVPGPPTQIVVRPLPTSILLPGQRSRLFVAEGDAYGNPVAAPVRAAVRLRGAGMLLSPAATVSSPDPGPGRLDVPVPGPPAEDPAVALSGPGVAAVYRAPAAPGTASVTVSVAGLPPARVTLRTVASPAAIVAGKGMWLTFPDWRSKGTRAILAAARSAGISHLYLEVATSSDGFYGARGLDDLLWQAHDAGIAVIAWVYAALWQPAQDIAVTRAVAAYATPLGGSADGLAADIEENLDPATVAAYAAMARQALGPRLLVGVTYPPQDMPSYPYAALTPYVDAWAPMDYWHATESDFTYHAVYTWVAASLAGIDARAGRPGIPFDPIAQTFDWFADSGTGIFSPTPDEVAAAMAGAAAQGAEGISFYRWTTATQQEWAVVKRVAAP